MAKWRWTNWFDSKGRKVRLQNRYGASPKDHERTDFYRRGRGRRSMSGWPIGYTPRN